MSPPSVITIEGGEQLKKHEIACKLQDYLDDLEVVPSPTHLIDSAVVNYKRARENLDHFLLGLEIMETMVDYYGAQIRSLRDRREPPRYVATVLSPTSSFAHHSADQERVSPLACGFFHKSWSQAMMRNKLSAPKFTVCLTMTPEKIFETARVMADKSKKFSLERCIQAQSMIDNAYRLYCEDAPQAMGHVIQIEVSKGMKPDEIAARIARGVIRPENEELMNELLIEMEKS